MALRHRLILASIAVVVLAAVTVVVVDQRRKQSRPLSQTITTVVGDDQTHQVPLPLLERRTVVIPDRPSNPGEGFQPGLPPPTDVNRRRSFEVSTNSIGLRGPELVRPAPRKRVVCLGGSSTFGWGVSYDESWCAQLGEILSIDPVIAAWPAAMTEHLLQWSRENAAAVDADLVLFTWGPGADDHNLARVLKDLESHQDELDPIELAWVIPAVSTFDPLGVQMARELYPTLPGRAPFIEILDLTPEFRARPPLPGLTARFADGRQQLVRYPGDEVVLDVAAPPPHPEFGQLLSADIIALFESDAQVKEALFFDQGHVDADGHRVFAEEVAEWIQAKGLLD